MPGKSQGSQQPRLNCPILFIDNKDSVLCTWKKKKTAEEDTVQENHLQNRLQKVHFILQEHQGLETEPSTSAVGPAPAPSLDINDSPASAP